MGTDTCTVLFTWLGTGMAVRGEISVVELVSLYGFSVFLATPVRILAESVKSTRISNTLTNKSVN